MAKSKKLGYTDRVLRRDPCAYCGHKGGTLDHIHPASANGINGWLNYTGSCQLCNSRKGSLSLLEYLLGKGWGRMVKQPWKKKRWLRLRDRADAEQIQHPLHTLLGINYWTGLPLGD